MTTDNRTNEPNKYAGFLARQGHQRDPWRGIGKKCLCGELFDLDADHAMHQVDEILRAALVAAAGAASGVGEHRYTIKARELHQTNSGLPAVQRVSESDALALVEEVIAIHADRIGTHYEDCYKYHVACLAVAVKHRIAGKGKNDE